MKSPGLPRSDLTRPGTQSLLDTLEGQRYLPFDMHCSYTGGTPPFLCA